MGFSFYPDVFGVHRASCTPKPYSGIAYRYIKYPGTAYIRNTPISGSSGQHRIPSSTAPMKSFVHYDTRYPFEFSFVDRYIPVGHHIWKRKSIAGNHCDFYSNFDSVIARLCNIIIISKGHHRGMPGSLLLFHLAIFGGQCPRITALSLALGLVIVLPTPFGIYAILSILSMMRLRMPFAYDDANKALRL